MTKPTKHGAQHIPEMTERQLLYLAAKLGSKIMPNEQDRKWLQELSAYTWYHNTADEKVWAYAREVIQKILERNRRSLEGK